MRLACTFAVLFACASPRPAEPARPPAPVAEAAPVACAEPPARAVAAAEPEPLEAPCAADADCATTRVARGACCPMLCTPRVVSRRVAEALRARSTACGRPCPAPLCRPPRAAVVPVCEAGRCVAQERPAAEEN